MRRGEERTVWSMRKEKRERKEKWWSSHLRLRTSKQPSVAMGLRGWGWLKKNKMEEMGTPLISGKGEGKWSKEIDFTFDLFLSFRARR